MNQRTDGLTGVHDGGSAMEPLTDAAVEEVFTISFFDHEIPSFVALELDRLYGNIYTSLAKFKLDGPVESVSTYVCRKGGDIIALLLFRQENRVVKVVNEMIHIEQREIERFAKAIFAARKTVNSISLNAIQTDLQSFPFPYLKFHSAQDIVLSLPVSVEEYDVNLGANLRQAIRRYTKKLKRTFPTFSLNVYIKDEADEQHIRDIYTFHWARMRKKNKVSNVTDKEVNRVNALVKTYGLVSVATIDGQVCAGLICWRVGENYFMRTIAHDPRFDDANLGTVCCYSTICECIERGGREFHFLSGRALYKFRFLGIERDFDRLVLYRSYLHLLRHFPAVLRVVIKGVNREARLWLLNAEHKDDVASRAAKRMRRLWRKLKSVRKGADQSHPRFN